MSDAKTNAESGTEGQKSTEPRAPEEIEAELEQTRHDLGETVDALSAKLDVKSRAKEQVSVTKQRAGEQVQAARERATQVVAQGKDAVTDEQGSVKPVVPAAAGGVALLVLTGLGIVLVRRYRRRHVVLEKPWQ